MSAEKPKKAVAKKPVKKTAKTKPVESSLPQESFDATKTAYEQLSPAHQFFVDEYITDFNGTRAYKAVPGFKCVDSTARANASKLLIKDNIQTAIQERIQAAGERAKLEISKERILKELSRMAFVDLRRLYREDGSMLSPLEIDDDTAAALAALEVTEEFVGSGADREMVGFTKKVKLFDKKGSIELLMKHMGMLKDKVEVGVTDEVSALLSRLGASAIPVKPKPDED